MLNTVEDLQWLRETHLRGVPLPAKYENFGCAVLQGNEDSPYAVNLYVATDPNHDDDYLRVEFKHEPPVYCEYIEFSGDKPKWTTVTRPTVKFTEHEKLLRGFAERWGRGGNVVLVEDDAANIGPYTIENHHTYVTMSVRVAEDDSEDLGRYPDLFAALQELAACDARARVADWLAACK